MNTQNTIYHEDVVQHIENIQNKRKYENQCTLIIDIQRGKCILNDSVKNIREKVYVEIEVEPFPGRDRSTLYKTE